MELNNINNFNTLDIYSNKIDSSDIQDKFNKTDTNAVPLPKITLSPIILIFLLMLHKNQKNSHTIIHLILIHQTVFRLLMIII